MNNKLLIIISLVLMGKSAFSQDQKLLFDMSWTYQNFEMSELNDFLIDKSFSHAQNYDSIQIFSGQQINFGIRYKLFPTFSLGVEGGYQFRSKKKTPTIGYTNPNTGEYLVTSYDTRIDLNAIRLGLSLGYSLSEALQWSNSTGFRNKTEIELQLKAGFARSKVNDFLFNANTNVMATRRMNHSSRDVFIEPQIILTRRLLNKPIFTGIGLKFGYQFLKTKPIENSVGAIFYDSNNLILEREVSLNFSGVNAGIILTIGN